MFDLEHGRLGLWPPVLCCLIQEALVRGSRGLTSGTDPRQPRSLWFEIGIVDVRLNFADGGCQKVVDFALGSDWFGLHETGRSGLGFDCDENQSNVAPGSDSDSDVVQGIGGAHGPIALGGARGFVMGCRELAADYLSQAKRTQIYHRVGN